MGMKRNFYETIRNEVSMGNKGMNRDMSTAQGHFGMRKVPVGEYPFPGQKGALWEIVNAEDGEPLSVEGIADELEIVGTHNSRLKKVMWFLMCATNNGMVAWTYYADDYDDDGDVHYDRLFIDPYFVKESQCKEAVRTLNEQYDALARRKARKARKARKEARGESDV